MKLLVLTGVVLVGTMACKPSKINNREVQVPAETPKEPVKQTPVPPPVALEKEYVACSEESSEEVCKETIALLNDLRASLSELSLANENLALQVSTLEAQVAQKDKQIAKDAKTIGELQASLDDPQQAQIILKTNLNAAVTDSLADFKVADDILKAKNYADNTQTIKEFISGMDVQLNELNLKINDLENYSEEETNQFIKEYKDLQKVRNDNLATYTRWLNDRFEVVKAMETNLGTLQNFQAAYPDVVTNNEIAAGDLGAINGIIGNKASLDPETILVAEGFQEANS